MVTNSCVGMLGLCPFGCQACTECQKLTEAMVRTWITSFWQRVVEKGGFSSFAFWIWLFYVGPASFTVHSLFPATPVLICTTLTSKTGSANGKRGSDGSSGSLPT